MSPSFASSLPNQCAEKGTGNDRRNPRAVSQEKFFAFIDSATAMINDNERLIHAHPTQSADAIAHLFRNMHTIRAMPAPTTCVA